MDEQELKDFYKKKRNLFNQTYDKLKDLLPDQIENYFSSSRVRSQLLFGMGTLGEELLSEEDFEQLHLEPHVEEFYRNYSESINGFGIKPKH